MKTIITVQHTQSHQHINKMIGSWADWELTEAGILQAHNIGKKLSEEFGNSSFYIYSSDLLRAKQTADIVSSYFHTEPHTTDRLREYNLGEAVGKSKAWAKEHLLCDVRPKTVDWPKHIDCRPFRGAETIREFWDRLFPFFYKLLTCKDENIILVAHDGTLRLFFAMWMSMRVEMLENYSLAGKSGGVSVLHQDDDGHRIITRLNDHSYYI